MPDPTAEVLFVRLTPTAEHLFHADSAADDGLCS